MSISLKFIHFRNTCFRHTEAKMRCICSPGVNMKHICVSRSPSLGFSSTPLFSLTMVTFVCYEHEDRRFKTILQTNPSIIKPSLNILLRQSRHQGHSWTETESRTNKTRNEMWFAGRKRCRARRVLIRKFMTCFQSHHFSINTLIQH